MEFKAYEWSNEIERKNAEFTFAILRCFDCDRQNKIEKAYFKRSRGTVGVCLNLKTTNLLIPQKLRTTSFPAKSG